MCRTAHVSSVSIMHYVKRHTEKVAWKYIALHATEKLLFLGVNGIVSVGLGVVVTAVVKKCLCWNIL